MARFNDVRLTCSEIASNADLELGYVRRIMAQHEPMGVDEQGEALYSIAQMMAAMFRGERHEKTEQRNH